MKIHRIRARELDTSLVQRWRELQSADPSLASPYFCVEYVQAVDRIRPEVYVGVIEVDGVVQGFFPFERVARTAAGPVGGRLSDYHGLIAAPGLSIDAQHLVRSCGVRIWDFDHVPASQQAFERHASVRDESPIMDLAHGYQGYLEQRKAAGAQRVSQMLRKARKFEREVGALRFEADSRDARAFAQVIRWKREQCVRTGVPDFLSWGWTTDMLEAIGAVDTPAFAGRLSVLWHGDEILAAHFGMRSDRAWHWWFPGYNDAYGDYSPGGILLLKVAEAAAACGVRYVDLGKGDDAYKRSFATSAVPLLEGSVLVPSVSSLLRRARRSSEAFLRGSPALEPARAAARQVRDWLTSRQQAEAAAGR